MSYWNSPVNIIKHLHFTFLQTMDEICFTLIPIWHKFGISFCLELGNDFFKTSTA